MNERGQFDWNTKIRSMFATIASRYDLMNSLMTFGRDQAWRRKVVYMADLPPGGRLLDIGTGTGNIALEAVKSDQSLKVAAADLTPEMIRVGMRRAEANRVMWCCANALELPFADGVFDGVTSGYLIRNVPDISLAFKEQLRVVKPGGKVVCLDTSPPPDSLLRIFVLFHLKVVIPLLGGLISGNREAYRYLPESTQKFKTPKELAEIMRQVGFENITVKRLMLGTMGIVCGIRPRGETS